jgi:hypothetical protein
VVTNLDTKHLVISQYAPCEVCQHSIPVSLYSHYFSFEISERDSAGIAKSCEYFHHAPGRPVCAVCGEAAEVSEMHLTPAPEVDGGPHTDYKSWVRSPASFLLVHPPCIGISQAA